MKTAVIAEVSSDPGAVVETTTRRRVISSDQVARDRTTPDFWQYVEALTPTEWQRHVLYIYRQEPGPSTQIEKLAGYIAMPDGSQIQLTSQEEFEYALGAKHGGRVYRMILKRGAERVAQERVYIDTPPKVVARPADPGFAQGGMQQTESSATADIAREAIHAVTSQEGVAVNVAVNALQGAATVIERFSKMTHQPAAPSASDEMMKQIFSVLIERALNPPPPPPPLDPLEQMTKFLALMNQINPAGGGAGNPVLNKILDGAVEKLLNPPATGPSSSTGAELVRQLPQVANYVSQAMAEWRHGAEAQRDTAVLMKTGVVPVKAPGAPNPAVLAAPQALQENPTGMPTLEFIESRIVEILKEPISAEQAADETIAFLVRIDPALVRQLAMQGAAGLLQLFQTRPTLKPATVNIPRLQEFIAAFLKFDRENTEGATEDAKPN